MYAPNATDPTKYPARGRAYPSVQQENNTGSLRFPKGEGGQTVKDERVGGKEGKTVSEKEGKMGKEGEGGGVRSPLGQPRALLLVNLWDSLLTS